MKFLIIIGIIVLMWCPWLKQEEAISIMDANVAQMKKDDPNLCAMTIHKETIRKVPFGYTEEVSYDCTVTDPLYGVVKSRNTVLITFYKGLLGMPNKSVVKNP